MSHPIPGHDYSEQTRGESDKDYKKRADKATKKKIAKKMKPGEVTSKGVRYLTKKERKEKTKNWPMMQKGFDAKKWFDSTPKKINPERKGRIY